MIFFYKVITTCLYPILVIFIYFRKFKNKEHRERYKEKIFSSNFNVHREKNYKLIWFHAASIGELKSILPLISELNKKGDLKFLITTVTLSSANLAEKELAKIGNSKHRFLPVDVEFIVKRFLSQWKPDAIFFVDSEIWPNIVLNAKKNKIPLALINARLTKKSFNRWLLFPSVAKKIFQSFNLFLTSNIETKDYLSKLNIRNVHYKGNLKLISYELNRKFHSPNDEFLKKEKFWFAASTHDGEDEMCIQTHLNLKKKLKEIKTIIAPRHINRSNLIKQKCDKYSLDCQIINENDIINDDKEFIIINSFGNLHHYYKFGESVFIGKSILQSLEKVGGQNPLEAAHQGCKIYHGPFVSNFKEIYELLEKKGISKKITNSEELTYCLLKDFDNPNKFNNNFNEVMNDLSKRTLDETLLLIENFLLNENK